MAFNLEKYNQISEYIVNNSEKTRKISIIAVSKSSRSQVVEEAIKKGIRIFGENKVQEAHLKFQNVLKQHKDIELHMIGPLQTNKVKKALEIFDYFHSLDRESLAKEFCKDSNFVMTKNKNFFIQVNTGMEKQKSGVSLSDVDDFVNYCTKDLHLNIIGFMCIPPFNEDATIHFKKIRILALKHKLEHLSMGMSNDYKKAIKEGATFIRIGTLLFGNR